METELPMPSLFYISTAREPQTLTSPPATSFAHRLEGHYKRKKASSIGDSLEGILIVVLGPIKWDILERRKKSSRKTKWMRKHEKCFSAAHFSRLFLESRREERKRAIYTVSLLSIYPETFPIISRIRRQTREREGHGVRGGSITTMGNPIEWSAKLFAALAMLWLNVKMIGSSEKEQVKGEHQTLMAVSSIYWIKMRIHSSLIDPEEWMRRSRWEMKSQRPWEGNSHTSSVLNNLSLLWWAL